jgi:hypothetical protein
MTINELLDAYFSDVDSPFHKLRYPTRVHYRALAKRLRADLGALLVAELKARQIKHWHEGFVNSGIVSMGHSVIGMLRIISGFGATILDNPACAQLSAMLGDMRFQMAKPRVEFLTAEQVIAIRGQAHKAGLRSIAIMQAFQFDLMLRQKDKLGEWVPLSEPVESYVIDGDNKWVRGALWEEIDENLIFTHVTSKRQKKIVRDLNLCPMITQEFLLAFGCVARNKMPERGPIIVSEISGKPWYAAEFRRNWRLIARAAGIPDHVRNMDSRAGAITEALMAGVPLDKVRKTATHSDPNTTARYSRNDEEAASDVMQLRVAARKAG